MVKHAARILAIAPKTGRIVTCCLITLVNACGSASSTASSLPRRLNGRTEAGYFVSASAYESFLRAELHRDAGEWREAAADYRMALADAEEDPYVIAQLADALDRGGESAEAVETLASGAERHPHSEAIDLARGRIARRHHDDNTAIAAFTRATEDAPDSSDAVVELAESFAATGDVAHATTLLRAFCTRSDAPHRDATNALFELALIQQDAQLAAETLGDLLGETRISREKMGDFANLIAAKPVTPRALRRVLSLLPHTTVEEQKARIEFALVANDKARAASWIRESTPEALGGAAEAATLALRANDPALAYQLATHANTAPALADIAATAAEALHDYDAMLIESAEALRLAPTPARKQALLRAMQALALRN